jgi:glycosyltransferase involved in cell wall biosynthesis
MIVRDEAQFIEDCLESVRHYVDECVIVDTGSTDGTREIAAGAADILIDFEWISDFSAARNAGLDAVTGDWVLMLDADERVASDEFASIRQAISSDHADGYYLTARNYLNEQASGWIPVEEGDRMARGFSGYTIHQTMKLFRSRPEIRFRGRIHEIVDDSIDDSRRDKLPVVVHHYTNANDARPKRERALSYLKIMEEELAEQEDARLLAIAGNTLLVFTEDYQKAARYLHRAGQLGYRPAECLEQEAEARYRGGEFGPALDLYRSVYRNGVRTPAICLNMANLFARSGDKARAAELLRECLQLGGVGTEMDQVIRSNLNYLES